MKADLLITNIGQLVTCSSMGVAKRRSQMLDVGLINYAAIAIVNGKILAAGPTSELEREYEAEQTIDAKGAVVCPGLVDPHTHIVFAGNRLDEFELKIQGADYLKILGSGAGILSTVRQTRSAT